MKRPLAWLVLVPAILWSGCVGHRGVSPAAATGTIAAARLPDSSDDRGDIAQLIRGLTGSREAARTARERLIEIGSEAVPALLETLDSPDFSTRWGGVNVLGYIQDRRALMPLVQLVLHDPNNHVRWRSIWATNRMHDATSAAELHRGLADDSEKVRWNAAIALSMLGDPDSLPVLVAGLKSTSPWQKWEAINALGRVHDEHTVAALTPLLADPDLRVRQETALSLGRIAGEGAVAALIEALSDAHPGVRWRAGMALAQIGDPRAIAPMEQALTKETDRFAKDELAKTLKRLKERR